MEQMGCGYGPVWTPDWARVPSDECTGGVLVSAVVRQSAVDCPRYSKSHPLARPSTSVAPTVVGPFAAGGASATRMSTPSSSPRDDSSSASPLAASSVTAGMEPHDVSHSSSCPRRTGSSVVVVSSAYTGVHVCVLCNGGRSYGTAVALAVMSSGGSGPTLCEEHPLFMVSHHLSGSGAATSSVHSSRCSEVDCMCDHDAVECTSQTSHVGGSPIGPAAMSPHACNSQEPSCDPVMTHPEHCNPSVMTSSTLSFVVVHPVVCDWWYPALAGPPHPTTSTIGLCSGSTPGMVTSSSRSVHAHHRDFEYCVAHCCAGSTSSTFVAVSSVVSALWSPVLCTADGVSTLLDDSWHMPPTQGSTDPAKNLSPGRGSGLTYNVLTPSGAEGSTARHYNSTVQTSGSTGSAGAAGHGRSPHDCACSSRYKWSCMMSVPVSLHPVTSSTLTMNLGTPRLTLNVSSTAVTPAAAEWQFDIVVVLASAGLASVLERRSPRRNAPSPLLW